MTTEPKIEVGGLRARWESESDAANGLPQRKHKPGTYPDLLARIEIETGATPSPKMRRLVEQSDALLVIGQAAAGTLAVAEAEVRRLEKDQVRDDAEKVLASVFEETTDLPDSLLVVEQAHVVEAKRFAAAVRQAQSQNTKEITAAAGMKSFANFLGKLWVEFVAFEITDDTTVGEAAAIEARSAVVRELIWSSYRSAIYTSHAQLLKPLRAAFDEVPDTMPLVKEIEAKLYATKAEEVAEVEADKVAKEKHEILVHADAQAAQKARLGTPKVDRGSVA